MFSCEKSNAKEETFRSPKQNHPNAEFIDTAWAVPTGKRVLDSSQTYFTYNGATTLDLKTKNGVLIGYLSLSEVDKLGKISLEYSLRPEWMLATEVEPIQVQSHNLTPCKDIYYPYDSLLDNNTTLEIFEAIYYSFRILIKPKTTENKVDRHPN